MSERVDISEATKRVIVSESGGFCVNPDCRAVLVEKLGVGATWLGECAHIRGERPGARRFDANMSSDERNADGNLLALCPSCHTKIDKPGAEAHYTVSMLLRWKEIRRAEVGGRAAQRVMDVGFQELSRVVRVLVAGGFREDGDDDITVVPPEEKIEFNVLSGETRNHIALGLARQQEVVRYLHHERRVNANITPSIRAAIVDTYRRCRARASGDSLFHMVWNEVSAGLYTDCDHAAALVVTCYFFEACDIFERPLP
jgi:hypothetical protein